MQFCMSIVIVENELPDFHTAAWSVAYATCEVSYNPQYNLPISVATEITHAEFCIHTMTGNLAATPVLTDS